MRVCVNLWYCVCVVVLTSGPSVHEHFGGQRRSVSVHAVRGQLRHLQWTVAGHQLAADALPRSSGAAAQLRRGQLSTDASVKRTARYERLPSTFTRTYLVLSVATKNTSSGASTQLIFCVLPPTRVMVATLARVPFSEWPAAPRGRPYMS